ncbi:MAG: M42 family metallopeptidase [Planctomycetes bacterium]|nr:M42 family metallopeptidase [Planctomycetota bacterium]
MTGDDTLALLKEATAIPGVPGYEKPVAEWLKVRLAGIARVDEDRMGNVFFEKEGASARPRIVLPAHMDEIGLMVKLIDDKGFIRFWTLGGWFSQVLLAQRVVVINGRGESVPGVIGSKPPHLMDKEDAGKVVKIEDMFIDVGASSKEEVEEGLGIAPGDPIVPDAPFTVMAGGKRILAKAWDDRVGLAVMVRVLEELRDGGHPNTVIGCATVQEEVGTRGAKTVAATADPDVALVLESGIAADVPGIKQEEAQGEFGKGAMVCVLDGGLIPHRGLRDFVTETARAAGIPYQYTSLKGGTTDGRELQYAGRGVPSLYLGVPCRYIHAHHGILDTGDFESSVRLVVEVIRRLDEAAFEGIIGMGAKR